MIYLPLGHLTKYLKTKNLQICLTYGQHGKESLNKMFALNCLSFHRSLILKQISFAKVKSLIKYVCCTLKHDLLILIVLQGEVMKAQPTQTRIMSDSAFLLHLIIPICWNILPLLNNLTQLSWAFGGKAWSLKIKFDIEMKLKSFKDSLYCYLIYKTFYRPCKLLRYPKVPNLCLSWLPKLWNVLIAYIKKDVVKNPS